MKRARFQDYVGVGRARRAEDNGDAAPEREQPAEIKEPRANERDATGGHQGAGDARAAEWFARE